MSLLDSFYILFKTNAKEAEKDTLAFDKAATNLTKNLQSQNKVTDSLASSFFDLAAAGTAALGSIIAFSSLKSGIINAEDFNAELEKQQRLIKINANDLSAWGGAVEQAGGDGKEFVGWLSEINKQYALLGIGDRVKNIPAHLLELSKQFQNLSNKDSLSLGLRYGLPESVILLLQKGPEEVQRLIDKQKQLAPISEENAQHAREFASEMANLDRATRNLFTQLGEGPFTNLIHDLTVMVNLVSKLVEGVQYIFGFASKGGAAAGDWAHNLLFGAASSPPSNKSALDASTRFWMAQGYTAAQAAGLVANEQRESGGNPNAIGDSGAARGIFQWHPDRRKSIMDALGIDVANSSHEEQLRAAAWELEQRGDAAKLRQATSAGDAASIISNLFERPKNGAAEAALRAQMAQSLYSSNLVGTAQSNIQLADTSAISIAPNSAYAGGKMVQIDNLTVHTIATDADGVAKAIDAKLNEQFRVSNGNWNDGVER